MLDTVTVTFADGPTEREPVVSTGHVARDAAFDFTGASIRTIAFAAVPELPRAPGTSGRGELRRMSPYSGVSSLSYCRVFPIARGTVHAPQ
jgi:hypothetical protein